MKFKDIESARKRYNQLVTAMQAIVGGEGDNMTAEQKTTFDDFKNEAEAILKDFPTANIPDGVLSQPDQLGNHTEPARPKTATKYFKDPKLAYDFGMFALAVGGNPGALGYCQRNGIYASTQSEGSNTYGGYLVPTQFEKTLIDLRNQYGVFRRNAKVVDMTSDQCVIPRRTGGLTSYYVAEAGSITESVKSWDQIQLSAKKLGIITKFTSELAEDAVISLGDDLANEISWKFAWDEDLAGFNGDGTSTYGGITGIVTRLSDTNGTDDGGGLVLAAGNLFSEITLANFTSMIGRLPAYAMAGAKWYCSSAFYGSVMLRLAYSAGGVSGSEVLAGSSSRGFLGFPVELAEVLPTTDANSQIVCLFGNLSQSSTFGNRGGIVLATSNSATVGSDNLFEQDMIALRGVQRYDIVNHDYGTASAAGPVVGLITASS